MKTLRATTALVVRDLPAGADTGRRLAPGQTVTAHGESYDRKWAYVTTPAGAGWSSLAYLTEATEALSIASLSTAASMTAADAARWLPHVGEAAARFDFTAPPRLAMWIAQCGHESLGFRTLVENLNYSAPALRTTWPTRFPTDSMAVEYARQPEKIANHVYANRMGNGPPASGDGWRFRGRGLIQLTGRDNYRTCGAALGVDLEAEPDLLATPRFAALSAGWFWQSRGLGLLADAGDILAVTKRINGGTHGLADRTARWQRAKTALGVA